MGGSRGTTESRSAVPADGGTDDSHRPGATPRSRRLRLPFAISSLLLLFLLSLTTSAAFAAGDAEHTFSRALKAGGGCTLTPPEEGKETGPGPIAVDESTGDVFVYDRGNNSIDRFDSTGACLNHVELGKLGSAKPGNKNSEGIAVDNASSSPSKGDVYVVEGIKQVIKKFKPVGGALEPVGELTEAEGEFAEIHGLAVDGSGTLWVYDGKGVGEGVIEKFSNAVTNVFEPEGTVSAAEGECAPKLGFAVGPNAETFYVGRKRETANFTCEGPTVMVKLDHEGQPVGEGNDAQLDNGETTGVAADGVSGEVYFGHAASVAAFAPDGRFVQRFGNEGGPGQLSAATGVATSAASGEVYVADGGEIKIYAPASLVPSFPLPIVKLADNRQWEQVTPQSKLGSQLFGINGGFGQVKAAADGNAITYVSSAPITAAPPTSRAPEPTQNLSRRGAASWGTEDIISPSGNVPAGYRASSGTQFEGFSEDLSAGIVNLFAHMAVFAKEPLLSPQASEDTPYVRDLTRSSPSCEPVPSTCYTPLVSPLNDTAGVPFGTEIHFAAATPDLQHAVVRSPVPLTVGAIDLELESGLYEWSSDGQLQLISVPPPAVEGKKETPLPSTEGEELRLGGPGENFGGVMRNAISHDGKRVVWSTNRGEGRLFVRDTSKHETLRIDKTQGIAEIKEKIEFGECSERCAQAQYQTADTNGTRIFFTDYNKLTADATVQTGEEGLEAEETRGLGDLYVCEIVETAGKLGCNLTDLTAAAGIRPKNEPAAVQGVIGASDDGSTVYYVADAALSPEAGPGRCLPRKGAARQEELEGKLPEFHCTLYVQHRGSTGWETPKPVATLSTQDASVWHEETTAGALLQVSSRVSPDGNFLSFMSNRSLTGYNNLDAKSGKRDQEVFLYDDAARHVSCVSCNPTGVQPTGVHDIEASGEGSGLLIDRVLAWNGQWLAADIPSWTGRSKETAVYQSRYLSNSGRMFFNSVDPLVPADESAKADVYEFEPNGVGGCTSANGCVSLMSSGTSKQESAFVDASADGDSVFFLTSEKLLSSDEDTGFDIYSARVCTPGSPCLTPPAPNPPPCGSEAQCKGESASVPAMPPVPASTAASSGNAGKTNVLDAKSTGGTKKVETRAQKLKKALKACSKLKKKKKRKACAKQARKKWGSSAKKGKKK